MSLQRDHSDTDALIDGNKNPTEVPIGEVEDVESRTGSMWRCGDCGEMGRIGDVLPERCPDCGAPREELFYWEED